MPTQGFQESWHIKINDPIAQRALWLRFSLFVSNNGFRRVAETWAIVTQRSATGNHDVTSLALKQTHEISSFSALGANGIRIDACQISESGTLGAIQSKGKTIRWDLKIAAGEKASFKLIPEGFQKTRIFRNDLVTVGENLRFSGTVQLNGETIEFKDAPGMQGHLRGPNTGHSWVWGHCNSFVDEQGNPTNFIFEGLTARGRLLGPLPSVRISSFYFRYQGQDYRFNTVWDSFHLRSKNSLSSWEFQADRGDLSFRGRAQAETRDFVGITYEDTNGSLVYCSHSPLSELEILVYRREKLEGTFRANGTATFEIAARTKNPYVPMLL